MTPNLEPPPNTPPQSQYVLQASGAVIPSTAQGSRITTLEDSLRRAQSLAMFNAELADNSANRVRIAQARIVEQESTIKSLRVRVDQLVLDRNMYNKLFRENWATLGLLREELGQAKVELQRHKNRTTIDSKAFPTDFTKLCSTAVLADGSPHDVARVPTWCLDQVRDCAALEERERIFARMGVWTQAFFLNSSYRQLRASLMPLPC